MTASSASSTASGETRRSLGLCVSSTNATTHVFGLVEAARRAGVQVDVFLTGAGVRLLTDERFPTLLGQADRVGVCEVSALQRGIRSGSVVGLCDKDFVTQARNAELAESCDRYLVF